MTVQTLTQSQPISLNAAADAAAAALQNSNGTSSTSGTTTAIAANALQSLSSNFNDFLSLLLTQVKNQDPTSPTDTTQFTTELVQFTGVQQQVATNSNLNQLISLQQTSQVLQSSDLVGHHASVQASQITLQSSTGQVSFTGTAGEPVAVAVVDSSGNVLRDASITANAGTNSWTWNGLDNSGNQVPDGAYRIALETAPAGGGTPTAVPYTVQGVTTGVSTNGTTTMLQLGALSVPLSAVQDISTN
jgi:flagellar basal-body rod modification protein FlgD